MNKKLARVFLILLGIALIVITYLLLTSDNFILNILGYAELFINGYLLWIGWVVTGFMENVKESTDPNDERICAHTGEW